MADPQPPTTNPEPTTDGPRPSIIEDFLETRTQLVEDLVRLGSKIQVENDYESLLSVTDELSRMKNEIFMLGVYCIPCFSHIDACYLPKIYAIADGLIQVSMMILNGKPLHRCSIALFMLGMQVGRLTLAGVADPFAEPIDAKVREMLNMWGALDLPLLGFGEFGSQDLNLFWKDIDVVRPECECQQCSARRQPSFVPR